MDHVPHSIYIQPLRSFDAWPENPNVPITSVPSSNKIRTINTYDDWKIAPLSRPIVAPPQFKENYLDIPGLYGSLDFSRALIGLPIYGNRTGQWEFVVLNDFRSWEAAYSDIQHTIHGQRCIITLEDDKNYFYAGTLTLNEWRSDPGWSRIVINYNLDPFKYSKTETKLSIDIDSSSMGFIELSSELIGRKPVHPWIKVDAGEASSSVKVGMIYGNNELGEIQSLKLKALNKYVEIPEFILSNESGNNKASISFLRSDDSTYSGNTHIDIVYRRRYL